MGYKQGKHPNSHKGYKHNEANWLERFWARTKTNPDTGCLEWTGTLKPAGYGIVMKHRKTLHVHRVSYEINIGSIPEGMLICHKCDNRKCVNPDHLFLGTHLDNTSDMIAKGRQKFKEGPNSPDAKFTKEDILAIRSDIRSQGVIATEYKVNQSTISLIKRKRTYKNV